ncbi:MAG: hypothetical protein OEY97_13185 [Nitrospirota bacterium]|nr:hypothetical protein [Nitrospirota bacterium]
MLPLPATVFVESIIVYALNRGSESGGTLGFHRSGTKKPPALLRRGGFLEKILAVTYSPT